MSDILNGIIPEPFPLLNNVEDFALKPAEVSIAPILGIDRHRIDCDGEGVTTLVAFYGCPLNCKYCLNPECHKPECNWMSPQQLYDTVIIDDIYFRTTKGGITFGGGEPLSYPRFINEFYDLCKSHQWTINVETSLNVSLENLRLCAFSIDSFFVDIKCISNKQYISYTGKSNRKVIRNLEWLADNIDIHSVIIRIPKIPRYATDKDINSAIGFVKSLGFMNVDCFDYVLPTEFERARGVRFNQGKSICKVLKQLRSNLANNNGLVYNPTECTYDGPCLGTCPKCDAELQNITTYLNVLESNNVNLTI